MSFAQSIRTCFSKYVTFSGRAARPEYWWFILFLVLGSLVAGFLDGMLFRGFFVTGPGHMAAGSDGPLSGLFSLATFLPALAVGWRRMHDTGRSGLYMLFPMLVMAALVILALISGVMTSMLFATGHTGAALPPLSGLTIMAFAAGVLLMILSPLLMIWWLTRPSQPGSNDYGPAPQGPSAPPPPPSGDVAA